MDARQPETPKRAGLLSHLSDFLRWLLMLALVTAAVGAFALYFIHSKLDEEIRLYVETTFQRHYPEFIIRVRSAHRVQGRGVEIRGLSIAEPGRVGKPEPLVYVEELFAACATDLPDLAAGEVRSSRLMLRGIKLRAMRLPDGGWNLARLLPFPEFGGSPPITIEDGYLELIDLQGSTPRVLSLRDLALQWTPAAAPDVAAKLQLPKVLQIQGSFTGDYLGRITFSGQVDPGRKLFDLAGAVERLDLSQQTIDALPEELSRHLAPLRSATGMLNFDYRLAKAEPSSTHVTCELAGSFTGRVEDRRLPQPLSNVRLPFEYNAQGLIIRDAFAQFGPAQLQLSANLARLEATTPYALRLKATRLLLDEPLAQALPADWRALWDKFAPRGNTDADVTLQYDGRRLKAAVSAHLLDVSFAYHKFPYRVYHARGPLRFRDNLLELDELHASANGRPMLIRGVLANPGENVTGWLDVIVNEPLPIDQQLLDALQDHRRQLVQSLNPHGAIKLKCSFRRPDLSQPAHRQLTIELQNGALHYERFPYPLHNISGTLTLDNDRWSFQNLVGYNDSAFIVCNGSWEPDGEGGKLLTLDFNATDVPLEDELRDALNVEAQEFWRSLRPRGTIDHLDIQVRHPSRAGRTSISVTARKNTAQGNVEGRSIAVKPTWLPYQLDDVVGMIRFQDGAAELSRVRGAHGKAVLEMSGRFDRTSPDTWRLQLSDLHVRQLRTEHELISALPPRLGTALEKLNLQGAVSMNGSFGLEGVRGRAEPTFANWSLDFDVEDGRLESSVRLEQIRGGMHLEGSLSSGGHYTRGTLDIDSLVYQGVQLTQITGPLSIDDECLAFGEMVRQPESEHAVRPVRAAALDGTLVGSGRLWLNDEASFELDGELFDSQLATIMSELAPGGPALTAKTHASVKLVGRKGSHTLQGSGAVQLRDADIYDLPAMIRLFKLVRVKPPDETAFTSSDIRFRIEADRIYFDQIDFDGDAINLNGRGEMNLARDLNLVFNASVLQRDSSADRLLGPLLRESGGLFQVYVTGTLDDPQVVRGVEQTLQQVFPETARPERDGMSLLPRPREIFNRWRSNP